MNTASDSLDGLNVRHAYYIKLGRAGIWEKDSIDTGKLRFGWHRQKLEDVRCGRWDVIESQLRAESADKPQVATTD
jgi:hypothetical protein